MSRQTRCSSTSFDSGKLYRTGDLGRLRQNGISETLRRIYFQGNITQEMAVPFEHDAALLKERNARGSSTIAADVANR